MDSKSNDRARRLELRLWIRLLECAKLIEKQLRRNFQEEFATTLPRFDVLAALARAPDGLSMGDISRALLVSNGNVTAIVKQLSEAGHVETQIDPDDRRSAVVRLTSLGRAHFQLLADAHATWVHKALASFPAEDHAPLLGLLDSLKSSITLD